MVRPRALFGVLAVAAVFAVSCSADLELALPDESVTPSVPAESDVDVPPSPPPPTATPAPAGRAQLPEDQLLQPGPRIAIQTATGQIFTVLADGSNPVPLTDPEEGTTNSVPTWSLDANRLGWVTTSPSNGSVWVRSARFDGSDWFQQPMTNVPFYLAWDPTGSQVATLGPTARGLELGVVSLPDDSYKKVDEGSPFWFSWSPDADGFLVHASGLRLDLVPTDGTPQVLEEFPGAFQAPHWLDGAVQLIYADAVDGADFLVVSGDEGGGRRALVTYDGYLQFSVAPQTGLVAMYVRDPSEGNDGDTITVAFQDDEYVDIIDPINREELTIIATFGGDPWVVYPAPSDLSPYRMVGFYWSPDGNTLAWLVEVEAGDGNCGSETALYEWNFYTGTAVTSGPRFVPTATFACAYAPFFDQLSQSISFWSPDGSVLSYAGTDDTTGERGIWNVSIDSLGSPTFIAEGEIAVWSPQAAGSAGANAS
ncbi:MAG: TolB family protein [Acidimicrobiales bacterium]